MVIQDPDAKEKATADQQVENIAAIVNKHRWGLQNPHPLSKMRAEIVWEGKYDEFGNRREIDLARLNMPLQKIETIDEPASGVKQLGLFDQAKAHRDEFRNSLIWGDNKLVVASLLNEYRGSVQLIYIDPPFDVGADFTMDVPIGDAEESTHKDQSVLEMVAYRDTWGRGTDSYLHMLYERFVVMRDLLSETGSIFVHCDWRMNAFIRLVMNDVFGIDNFVNEITWRRTRTHNDAKSWAAIADTIYHFSKTEDFTWNPQYLPQAEEDVEVRYRFKDADGRRYRLGPIDSPNPRPNMMYEWKGFRSPEKGWRYSREKMAELDNAGRIWYPEDKNKRPATKLYLDESKGSLIGTVWTDISALQASATQRVGYPTQKPEALLERIIRATSNEGDLVADFFCGSGTTCAVAEKLNRRWIAADLGRFAIHTTRKRMIDLQHDQFANGQPYRAFDLYNLGRYERQWWQKERLNGADDEHKRVLLSFYKAELLTQSPSPFLHGRKGRAFVYVDNIDSLLTRDELKEASDACVQAGGKELHCLAWEFEMDLKTIATAIEHQNGIRIKLIPVPREVMEKNRIEPPPFLEMAELEVDPVVHKDGTVDVRLKRFIPSLAEIPVTELEALKTRAIKNGFDFIDFWSVDFEFAPGLPFKHQWQEYRTRKERKLKIDSDVKYRYESKGSHLICVKVIDVFGADTTISVEVKL